MSHTQPMETKQPSKGLTGLGAGGFFHSSDLEAKPKGPRCGSRRRPTRGGSLHTLPPPAAQ